MIFSTNLEPSHLVDDLFLLRIPYKVEIADPSPEEFHSSSKSTAASSASSANVTLWSI